MKTKILNILLIITSLLGYLEWGTGQNTFLFQAEIELFWKLFQDPIAVVHPLTLLPLLGQLLLLITLFQRPPSRLLTMVGLVCLSVLLLFIFLIGLLSLNFKILLSTIPFVITGILVIIESKRK